MSPAITRKLFKREVYRNLRYRNEHVYSVRKDGLVEGTALCVVLDGNTKCPVKFAVGEKGCQRVRDEERKNVHAVIRGCMVNAVWRYDDMDAFELNWAKDACDHFKSQYMTDIDGYKWMKVTYNPYKHRTFVAVEDERPILTARKVIISKEEVWALVPTEEKQSLN